MSDARILIDTGAIYAFVTRTDKHHRDALAFTKTCLKGGGAFVLADIVFAETMTLLKVRLGAATTVKVGRELRQNPAYLWIPLGAEGERNTWAVFQQYEDKDWSYTDCAILALARRLNISKVFSFDQHFHQMSAVVRVP